MAIETQQKIVFKNACMCKCITTFRHLFQVKAFGLNWILSHYFVQLTNSSSPWMD